MVPEIETAMQNEEIQVCTTPNLTLRFSLTFAIGCDSIENKQGTYWRGT